MLVANTVNMMVDAKDVVASDFVDKTLFYLQAPSFQVLQAWSVPIRVV